MTRRGFHFKFYALLLAILMGLSACQRAPTAYDLHGARGALKPTEYYWVTRGDTLFGIAWRYGLDVQDLAQWNGIINPDYIQAGSRIRLLPPSGIQRVFVNPPQVSSSGLQGWIWPTRGRVIREFNPNKIGHQGLKIAGTRGQSIVAARDGQVVYVGEGISGFGRMVIIRHENRIYSAYGYLATIHVRERQNVRVGTQIATMGISPQNIPALHFEVRQRGPSVNPYSFIGTTPRH